MTLQAAIADLQAKARAMSGIKEAPVEPPESTGEYPFVVTYPRSGSFELASEGFGYVLATLFTEIHCSRQLLGPGITKALPYAELFPQVVLADPTLGGAVAAVNDLHFTFGELTWGGIGTVGFRWEVDVKIMIP
jgi:hypothetical protein